MNQDAKVFGFPGAAAYGVHTSSLEPGGCREACAGWGGRELVHSATRRRNASKELKG